MKREEDLQINKSFKKKEEVKNIKRVWYRFSRNHLSCFGLAIVFIIIFVTIFANYITPYPESAGRYVNFSEAKKPPTTKHIFGTDMFGRDVFTRVIFGFRYSLLTAIIVVLMVVPVGVLLGLTAGYLQGTWIETIIMRATDVFLSIPALVLAMAICSVLTPNLINSMIAISLMWWPWYCRLVYGNTISVRGEFFVQSAEIIGAGKLHILFKEILPNCLPTILTKATLDLGFVILIGASLSFVGLGAQPPIPDLGTMVADGAKYLPELWWLAVFPAIGIVIIVLGFNLLGDGIHDIFN